MIRYIFKSVFISFIILNSCGADKDLAPQPNGKVKVPEYSTINQQLNFAAIKETQYYGQILFWHELATKENVQVILDSSNRNKFLEGDVIKLVSENLNNKENLKKEYDQLDKLNKEISDLQKELEAKDWVQYKLNTQNWFEDTLKKMVEKELLSLEQAEVSRQKFAQYCDMKVWELASSNFLNNFKYTSVPTPNILCENYYQSQNIEQGKEVFFSKEKEECADAPDASGKNYFACIWLHGVMNTSYWNTRYKTTENLEKIESFKQMISDGTFLGLINDNNYLQGWLEAFTSKPGVLGGRIRLNTTTPAVLIKASKQAVPYIALEGLNQWTKIFEDNSDNFSTLPDELNFFATLKDHPDYLSLLKVIPLMGKKFIETIDEKRVEFSVSHYKFNDEILVGDFGKSPADTQTAEKTGATINASLFSASDIQVSEMPEYKKRLNDQNLKIKKIDNEIETLKSKIEIGKNNIATLREKTIEYLRTTKTASLLLGSTSVNFKQNKDHYQLTLNLDKSKANIVACADFNGKSKPCASSQKSALPAKLQIDSKTGQIEFSFVLKDLEIIGFPSEGQLFQNPVASLTKDFLLNKTFKLELLSSKISGLSHFTGEATILGKNEKDSAFANVILSQYEEQLALKQGEFALVR